jgi:hypothetical protein
LSQPREDQAAEGMGFNDDLNESLQLWLGKLYFIPLFLPMASHTAIVD